MRKHITLVAAGVLLWTAVPSAQKPVIPATSATTDIGFQATSTEGDVARPQRYRDLGNGAVLQRIRFDREGTNWKFEGTGDYVGRTDQRFSGSFIGGSKVKMSFTWDQIPQWISASTQSPYSATSAGVLRLAPGWQAAIQSGQRNVADLARTSTDAELQSYRHVAAFNFQYEPVRQLDISANVSQSYRKGTMPWMASFAFSDAVEVSAPVDTRTTDVNSAIEWSTPKGLVRVGYAGSWFNNRVPTLVWDNPLRAYDTTVSNAYSTGQGGSQGQEASWPDNDQQGVTASGSYVLPGHTRVTGSLTTGIWRQNMKLLPVTINTMIPDTPLPRATADAQADTLAMNYSVTSRPVSSLWVSARYKYYDFNNKTPVFQTSQMVVMDQNVNVADPTNPISYTRRNLDVDAAVTGMPFAALRVGYSRADNDQPTRIYAKTSEDTYRTSFDTSSFGLFAFRAIYEHSARRGSEFQPEILAEIGEQADLRQFDIADRNRDRVTGLVQINPHKAFGLSASFGAGRDKYPTSGFGLQDSDTRTYSIDAEVTPSQRVIASANYTYERATASQLSRTASPGTPQVNDPTRNWGIDTGDHTESWGGAVNVVRILPRTDASVTYDHTSSRSTYVFRTPATWTLAPLLPLPPVTNQLDTAIADVRFSLAKHVSLGGAYWYDRYRVNDFATDPARLQSLSLPGALYLGSLFRPSLARTGSLRLIFIW